MDRGSAACFSFLRRLALDLRGQPEVVCFRAGTDGPEDFLFFIFAGSAIPSDAVVSSFWVRNPWNKWHKVGAIQNTVLFQVRNLELGEGSFCVEQCRTLRKETRKRNKFFTLLCERAPFFKKILTPTKFLHTPNYSYFGQRFRTGRKPEAETKQDRLTATLKKCNPFLPSFLQGAVHTYPELVPLTFNMCELKTAVIRFMERIFYTPHLGFCHGANNLAGTPPCTAPHYK